MSVVFKVDLQWTDCFNTTFVLVLKCADTKHLALQKKYR